VGTEQKHMIPFPFILKQASIVSDSRNGSQITTYSSYNANYFKHPRIKSNILINILPILLR
jgi:hypothetical protein